ncbi:hypothetical protein M0R45_035917 [Rubus argutus]|uniref:Uncharacterized protein n=1 Tax=Rubus argutus TaxID=59490 RepID=A0AAW1VUI9_RUBAR
MVEAAALGFIAKRGAGHEDRRWLLCIVACNGGGEEDRAVHGLEIETHGWASWWSWLDCSQGGAQRSQGDGLMKGHRQWGRAQGGEENWGLHLDCREAAV